MIYDITPFTTIDYPNEIACVVWIAGCNMRCRYCYNYEMIKAKGSLSSIDLKNFLLKRKGFLDGVVFSGGECTYDLELLEYANIAKELGYLVKVDTNGSSPDVISELVYGDLVDYVALDFKALEDKFDYITSTNFFNHFVKTLDILIDSNMTFEVRTTWHFDLLSIDDILRMKGFLKSRGYKNKYYLQKFLEVDNLTNLKSSLNEPDLSLLDDDFVLRGF